MIQMSSSKLLLFHVEDILGMAQLKSGKFRKIIAKFNLKTAVDEIIHIQKFTSDLKNVKMMVDFYDFPQKSKALSRTSFNLCNPSTPLEILNKDSGERGMK